ncbi:hypothetical protein FHX57_006346 [Paraburkholderia tropica]|uniref:hypothetical protein n=1 Tax=Paraburkholderia tropica TaxID=92647 RepID=UPI001622F8CB|nr:hypothetical protein [Paraburkholderia tropica]MBB2984543.1 hypothetical protein [Paraburkholderia tropica]MBB3003967.1 hypothetical protein [Paraburkholderia tropica]MBB6323437.1 hypothetical protein [Paraburkholderia tropica]
METLKTKIYEICQDVAMEFPGWKFSAGKFKNNSSKHTELVIDPGLTFDRGFGHLQPRIVLDNKRVTKLCKQLLGEAIPTAAISFQVIAHLLTAMPEPLRLSCLVCDDKAQYMAAIRRSNRFSENVIEGLNARSIDLKNVPTVLIAMLNDGISFIENHYQLVDEEKLLKNLPAVYTTRNEIPYDEMERQKGVVMCIVHIILGDFDFLRRYRSEDFKTVFPKRVRELEKIVAVLPDLKARFAETGSVI